MNRKELLKKLKDIKEQTSKLQSEIDKMQNIANTIIEEEKTECYVPKIGEKYWTLSYDNDVVCSFRWSDSYIDNMNLENNLLFRTKEEAIIELELRKLYTEIKKEAYKRNELVPMKDIPNEKVKKFLLRFNWDTNKVGWGWSDISMVNGLIPNCYFKTDKFTKEIIEKYGNKISELLNKKYKKQGD